MNYPSFSKFLITMMCLIFFNYSSFGRYKVFNFEVENWFIFIFIEFQCLKVTYSKNKLKKNLFTQKVILVKKDM
jgi:hypothetical protein